MPAGGPSLVDQLQKRFGAAIKSAQLDVLDPWIEVSPEGLVDVCRHLKETPGLEFDMLNCITVVDYLETDPKKAAKADFEPHLEVVYHLTSIQHKTSLVLKVNLPRWKNDVPGEIPDLATVSSVWRTADWHEREVYDMSGINFLDHPDLRRILCPEDWEGYPLRKDYEMPLEYHGIRGK